MKNEKQEIKTQKKNKKYPRTLRKKRDKPQKEKLPDERKIKRGKMEITSGKKGIKS